MFQLQELLCMVWIYPEYFGVQSFRWMSVCACNEFFLWTYQSIFQHKICYFLRETFLIITKCKFIQTSVIFQRIGIVGMFDSRMSVFCSGISGFHVWRPFCSSLVGQDTAEMWNLCISIQSLSLECCILKVPTLCEFVAKFLAPSSDSSNKESFLVEYFAVVLR